MVGHLIGAAGALSAMICLLAIRDGVLPPTTNLHTPDPECDLDYVPLTARRAEVRTSRGQRVRLRRPELRDRHARARRGLTPARPRRLSPPGPYSAWEKATAAPMRSAVGGCVASSRDTHRGGSRSATFCSAIVRSKETNASGAPASCRAK